MEEEVKTEASHGDGTVVVLVGDGAATPDFLDDSRHPDRRVIAFPCQSMADEWLARIEALA